MKGKPNSRNQDGRLATRRKFLAQSATLAAGLTIVPRHVLGGVGFIPPSDKVNLGFVGVGSQGLRVMLHFLREADVQGVAVCDVNKSSTNHPQWDTHEFCNSVQKLLGATGGWDWLSPDQPIQLTHSMTAPSGVSGREPCQKIVNAYYGTKQRSGNYNGCAAYIDFRELLEKQSDVDGVVVVPRQHAAEVVTLCEARLAKEAKSRERLKAGELGLDMYGLREKLKNLGVEWV